MAVCSELENDENNELGHGCKVMLHLLPVLDQSQMLHCLFENSSLPESKIQTKGHFLSSSLARH
jgi:hypothetical protein